MLLCLTENRHFQIINKIKINSEIKTEVKINVSNNLKTKNNVSNIF